MIYKSVSFGNFLVIFFVMGAGFLCYAETASQAEANPAATEAPIAVAVEANPAEPGVNSAEVKPCGFISAESIKKLQSERTLTAEKIPLVQLFVDQEKDRLQECLQTVTDKEMIGLTIIELARHSDKALADKAKSVEKHFDITSYVDKAFTDLEGKIPMDVITLLLRMEPNRVQTILSGLSAEKRQVIEQKLSSYIPTILIPTGSPEGDRYYVKILWDKEDDKQIDCLTKLLHQELLANRSIEAEKERMQKLKGQRWIYWYDKMWAIGMFDEALQCGAKPSFVKGHVN